MIQSFLCCPLRQLQGLVDRLVSCQYNGGQAATRLAELQKQVSNLRCVFPWPGLGERRQAVDQARALLEQSAAVAPLLSAVRTQVKAGRSVRATSKTCGVCGSILTHPAEMI